jgi:hypothetical protein
VSAPTGFLNIALTDGPTVASPTWTRADNLTGVMIETIEIERGRPTEWDKTSPGIATIRGRDTTGALDPTNPSSPLYPNLVPVKQAAICLYDPNAATWNYRFRGHIGYAESNPHESGRWLEFEIQLVDMLDILNDSEVVPDFAGNRVPTENMGDTFYTGQAVDDRLLAVLADSSTAFLQKIWPPDMIQMASGNIDVQGAVYSRGTALLRVIDEACDAEFPDAANRFITNDGQFAFRGRFYRFNPDFYTPHDNRTRAPGTRMLHWYSGDQAAFDAGIGAGDMTVVSGQPKIRVDKANLINAALVTAKGVSNAEMAGGTLFSSDSGSVATYGVRTGGRSMENLIIAHGTSSSGGAGLNPDQEAATYADVIVHNYKDPVISVMELTLKSPVNDGTAKYGNVWRMLTQVELSDMVSYYDTHQGGGGFTVGSGLEHDHFIESIKYHISALQGNTAMVEMTLGLTSRHYYRYSSPLWGNYGATGPVLTADFAVLPDGLDVFTYDFSNPGPSGPIVGYSWNFGDGGTSTAQQPSHTYASAGRYTVSLTVTGTAPDGTAATSHTVLVGSPTLTKTQTAKVRVRKTLTKTQTAKAHIA